MNCLDAVFFDMDGVVVLNDHLHKAAWIEFLANHGITVSDQAYEQRLSGRTSQNILGQFFPNLSPAEQQQFAVQKEALYRDIARGNIHLVPGVLDRLTFCAQSNLPTCLVTSAPKINVDFVFDQFEIDAFFQGIITGENVSKGKPDPEPYLLAAAKLKLNHTAHCLVIEDSPSGIASANAAGCLSMAITTSNPKAALANADVIISDYDEFEQALESLMTQCSLNE